MESLKSLSDVRAGSFEKAVLYRVITYEQQGNLSEYLYYTFNLVYFNINLCTKSFTQTW